MKELEELFKLIYREVQITIYGQLQQLLASAIDLSFRDDEGLTMRKATADKKLDFIIQGLGALIKVTKEVK